MKHRPTGKLTDRAAAICSMDAYRDGISAKDAISCSFKLFLISRVDSILLRNRPV